MSPSRCNIINMFSVVLNHLLLLKAQDKGICFLVENHISFESDLDIY